MGKFIDGVGKVLETLSPAIPIVGGVVQNILEGMNTRKARLYDTPANQIKRRLEAGMPMSSTSNITSGQAFQTKTADLGTSQLPQNIRTHVQTQVDRKQIELMNHNIRAAKAAADVATGERDWKLAMGTNVDPRTGITRNISNQARIMEAVGTKAEVDALLGEHNANIAAVDDTMKQIMYASGKELEGKIADVMNKIYSNQDLLARIKNLAKAGKLMDLQGKGIENLQQFQFSLANDLKSGKIPDFGTLMYLYTMGNMNVPDVGGMAIKAASLY